MNPYTPPQSDRLTKSRSAVYMVAILIGSLVATVPVGMAISILLYDADFEQLRSNGTAYYWVASSVLASIACSSVAAFFTIPRLNWLHFWLVYQAGWLVYYFIGIGSTSSRLYSLIYFWTPIFVPAIVASVAQLFCLTRKLATKFGLSVSHRSG